MIPKPFAQEPIKPDTLGLVNSDDQVLESPSLSGDLEVPSYELKFLLTEAQAHAVEARILGRLAPDPHADVKSGNTYQTLSLYCDTAKFDVFHRSARFKRRKHRVRRYGEETSVFLERKTRRGDRVKKRRVAIPVAELTMLAHPASLTDWAGHWFHRHLLRRGLQPMCRIAYERVAYMGQSHEGPLRLTFDRRIRGLITNHWDLSGFAGGLHVLADQVVCEFKYRAFMPSLFKDIVQALNLTPSPVSKYRTFLRASGLPLLAQPQGGAAADGLPVLPGRAVNA